MITLPLSTVTVMEDRAQVERRGVIALVGGVTTVEVTGLPLVAVDRSLKVEASGAVVHEAKLVRRWKQKPKGPLPADASALRQRVQGSIDAQYGHESALYRLQARQESLRLVRQSLLASIAERVGFGQADVASWNDELETVTANQRKNEDELHAAARELEAVKRALKADRAALALAEEHEEDLECVLALRLEGTAETTVKVSYLVPCAVWRPAYRATLSNDVVLLEAEAVVWQRTGEPWTDVELKFSTARPTLGTTPPSLRDDWLSTRPKAAQEKRQVEVAVREEVIQRAGESSAAGPVEFPGLDDGGEARLLEAQGRSTVPSDGQPHRVPLSRFEAKAALERVCPTELAALVFTVARFPNAGTQVLLAGPVDLIRSAGFVGRSQLPFAAPGETIKLSFGSEDGLRVTRQLQEKVDEARLTGRRTTRKNVTLFVSNASPDAQRVVLEERIFVSEVKEVEVQVVQKECNPAPSAITKDGVARIELALPANATKKVTFVWEVSAAGKVAGL